MPQRREGRQTHSPGALELGRREARPHLPESGLSLERVGQLQHTEIILVSAHDLQSDR